jgi:hypothetical protein
MNYLSETFTPHEKLRGVLTPDESASTPLSIATLLSAKNIEFSQPGLLTELMF